MRIGFLGCGKMAHVMATVLSSHKEFELYGCAARDFVRAKQFQEEFNFLNAYHSYEEMVKDKNIDVIYISTVTKTHFDNINLCLLNKKNVLCEKPFCVNAKETAKVIDLAKKNNVFLGEAIWTRFLPSRKKVDELISSGIIGKPYYYASSIGYHIDDRERMQDAIGGGVLLDCGVYPINFTLMFEKDYPFDISAKTVLSSTGVDEYDSIILRFKNGSDASIYCSMKSNIDCSAYIYGDKGYIKLDHVNYPTKIEVFSNDRPPVVNDVFNYNNTLDGYVYQWLEVEEMLKQKKIEFDSMPLKETLAIMTLLDEIRSKAGIKFKND